MTALSCLGFVPLVLFASCAAGPRLSIETRTLSPVSPGESGIHLMFNQRIVSDKTVVFLSRAVQPDGSVFYSQREYRVDGTPIVTWQEGFWADRWNRFETRASRI